MTAAAPSTGSITLEDAGTVLGDFIASIMNGLDAALAEVGDDRWKDGVRDAVIREASHAAIDEFIEVGIGPVSVETLDARAVQHLGRYAAARARALTIQERARRADR